MAVDLTKRMFSDAKADELIEALKTHVNISAEAKAALINCFQHVAWVDENGLQYCDALYQALSNEWDYSWDSSSLVPPTGMTYNAYDFTTDPGAMFVRGPILDFHHTGNCKLVINCKFRSVSDGDNNPQIIIRGAADSVTSKVTIADFRGNRAINEQRMGSTIGGDFAFLDGNILQQDYHKYEFSYIDGLYLLKVDGNTAATGNGHEASDNSNIITGIRASDNISTYIMLLKSIQFRRL